MSIVSPVSQDWCSWVYVGGRPRRRQWHPTPVLLPGKSYGQRSLVGCSPWPREESDMTEWLPFPCLLAFCSASSFASRVRDRPSSEGSYCLVAKSCLTLINPWTVAQQAPLSMGFPRQEYWSRLPFPFPGDFPDLGFEHGSPALQADSSLGRFFTVWGTRESQRGSIISQGW